jgi:ribonuclease Y
MFMSFFGRLSQFFGDTPTTGEKVTPGVKKSLPKIPVEPITSATPVKPTPKAPVVIEADETSFKEAQSRAREILVEARSEALKIREKAEEEARRARQSQTDQQRTLDQKLNALEQRLSHLDKKEEDLENTREALQKETEQVRKSREKILEKLESVAKMTTQEAKEFLLKNLEGKLSQEKALIIRQKEEEAKQLADIKARSIIVEAMKHGVIDFVPEYTVSVVRLPDEEVKGRIIGKAGRNIHTFERTTGVDVDLDGSPNEVRLSCFDPIRREVARLSLLQLIKDGRIQPTRIEEVVAKMSKDMDKLIFEEGKKLCHSLGIYNLPNELVNSIGRYKFTVINGQNMGAHTYEQVQIGVKLAKEVGANVDVVRLGCLLQDVGKMVMDAEENHVQLGVRLLKKHNMPQAVIDAVAQHEEDEPFTSVEAVLVNIADKITSSRPGASYKDFEEHVARLEKLEEIALSYEAVEQAFAIQAGREVRVILNPEKSKDDDVIALSHSIKEQIQHEMAYPGTVKVTVIRENRVKKVAR